MLQLEPDKYDDFSTGEVINIMGSGVEKAVVSTWMNVFSLFEALFTTVLMIGLTAYISFRGESSSVKKCFILLPFVMGAIDAILIAKRSDKQASMYGDYLDEEDAWKKKVAQYTELRQVITTYRQGVTCGNIFKDTHIKSNKKFFAAGRFSSVTGFAARYLHTVIAMLAFCVAGQLAIDGAMQPGDFIALMGTIFKFDAQAAQNKQHKSFL